MSNYEEQNVSSDQQSTFDVEVSQPVPQVEKEIDSEGKSSYGQKEKIVFRIDPNNVEYFDSRSCYFTWDLEINNASNDFAGYVMPNSLAGAGGGLVNVLTVKSGNGDLLSQTTDYSVFHSMLHPHTCAESRQRVLQDFSFGAGSGDSAGEAWDLQNQPFTVVTDGLKGTRTPQRVKVCWRPYQGILNNYGQDSKVIPNSLLGGLEVNLETEEYVRSLFPCKTTISNDANQKGKYFQDTDYPLNNVETRSAPNVKTTWNVEFATTGEITDTGIKAPSVAGATYAVANTVALTGGTGALATCNIRAIGGGGVITLMNIENRGSGFTAGDILTVTTGDGNARYTVGSVEGGGAVGNCDQKALYKVGDEVHVYGDINGVGIVDVLNTTVADLDTTNLTGKIVYTLTDALTIPADEAMTDVTLRRGNFENMTYTIYNPKLVVRQLVLNPAQKSALNSQLTRADGSIGFEYVDVSQVKKSVNRNELVTQMEIPLHNTRCLGVISQPQNNGLLNSNSVYGWVSNAYTNESSYQYLVHNILSPNRKVEVDGTETKALHIYELTKALTQSGVDVQRNKSRNLKWSHLVSSIDSSLNFKIGRALGEWSNSVNLQQDGSLSCIVNYANTGRAHDDLWTHYVFHKRLASVSPAGVRVVY